MQQIQASGSGFADIGRDGSVVTWGIGGCGGNSTSVEGQLRHVQQVQASESAFAAILGDGSVVTWGVAGYGGIVVLCRISQEFAANPGLVQRFCCHHCEWTRRYLGRSPGGSDSSAVRD